jgi:hypothetical protein
MEITQKKAQAAKGKFRRRYSHLNYDANAMRGLILSYGTKEIGSECYDTSLEAILREMQKVGASPTDFCIAVGIMTGKNPERFGLPSSYNGVRVAYYEQNAIIAAGM